MRFLGFQFRQWPVWIFAGLVCLGLGGPKQAYAAFSAADTALFEEANREYREGNYESAGEKYRELSNRYPKTAAFYFNLGNSLYRSGVIGASILAFERAKMFDPRNRDIRENVEYVRGLLEYKIEDKRNWYVRAGERVLERYTEMELGLVLLIIYGLFTGSCCFMIFFRRGEPWKWKRKTLIVLFCVFGLLYLGKKVETRIFRDAIVISREAEVRYGPSSSDQVAFRLSEGLKTYVIDHREKWSRIVLVDGQSGWVKNNQIAEVLQS